ncbi:MULTISPECIES: hypothetical protein [Sphingomonas]|uniref:hypothetical protein n=1 Tax=Sphingomonas TaxID=13687 RepID=UPI000ADC8749|nr:hypothetical protein [Sphingomonas sp. Leaf230]
MNIDRMHISGTIAGARRSIRIVPEQLHGGVQNPRNAPRARAMPLSYIAEP